MSEASDITPANKKKVTGGIKAVTQKIALAEEKLEEAISQEIDSVEQGAKKVDQAVSSFSKNHPMAYGLLITLAVAAGLIVMGYLCAAYYSNR